MGKATGETSATVRKRVIAARKIQAQRMSGSGTTCNAQVK
ncbi:ATP-binding protein, partial [bacterium]